MLVRMLALFAVLLAPMAPPHDPEQRLAEVTARIQRRPDDPALYVERGQLHLALGHARTALCDFDAALRLAPQQRDALVDKALAEHRLGNEVEALLASRKATQLGVRSARLQRLQGRILMALARPAEAARAFATALANGDRPEPEHHLETAAAFAAAGKTAEARAVLDDGLAKLGPVIGLVDAAVVLDVGQREFARALSRLDALRPYVQRPAPLLERRARVLQAAGPSFVPPAAPAPGSRAGLGPVTATMPRGAAPAVPVPPPMSTTLIPTGAVWRYYDLGTLPGANWQAPTFDDSAWASGPAQLGYGDGDEATVVASGPAGAHFPTTWFRHSFALAAPPAASLAGLRLLCDDGAVVYINGFEVARTNLPTGPIGAGTWASSAIAGAAESTFQLFAVPSIVLGVGTNVVAVEIHQVSATSSDISFDLELFDGGVPLAVVRGPYLQDGTPHGAVVRWRTNQPTGTQLWLGSSPASMQSAYFDAGPSSEHAARVSGLQPETTYHYAIGDANGMFATVPPATLTTLPPPGAVRPVRAWILGDAGTADGSQLAVRNAYAIYSATHRADAMLLLGDNAYTSGTDAEYQAAVFDVYGDWLRDTFCWSTLGNHDAMSASSATQHGVYYDVFDLPANGEAGGLPSGTEAYYSFDRGHVHFVCLDS
ncbi:MAG TPA: fibronectin type III domain-containing protein, partial [Planctomycetota bacterium]|nr:fibronectin type III domain-containing protein [Planctomycetota bacterium]